MKPISCHTLANIQKSPTYELTVTIPFNSRDLSPEDVARHLAYVLNAPHDDQGHFDSQLFYHGLSHCLQRALRAGIDEEMQRRYPDERVPHERGGWTARWCLEAEKVSPPSPYRCGAARVEMRQVDEG